MSNWLGADPWVIRTVEALRSEGCLDALDLGGGVARHSMLMALSGMNTHYTDKSIAAAHECRRQSRQQGADITVTVSDMAALPYAGDAFDFVLAFNVVYHSDEHGLGMTLGEIRRVLRRGSRFHATMLSKRNVEYGRGIEVASNTFCQPDAPDDKVHPHLYLDEPDLLRLYQGFEIINLQEAEQRGSGSYHWYVETTLI